MNDFFRGFKEGQKAFGETIITLVNFVLLSLVYFVGVGLTSIALKLFNYKFLNTQIEAYTPSYWEDTDKDIEGGRYKQF